MTQATQGTLLLATGLVAARLVQTGAYLNYLKQGMGRWLLGSAVILIAVGLISIVRAFLGPPAGSHDHPMTRAAWLLVLPALAVIVVPTDPLGAFAADRRDFRLPETVTKISFPPLPEPEDGAVEIGLREFVDRAFVDKDRSLDGVRVRLTGFAGGALNEDSFVLSRFVILCCAADAYPVEIDVVGASAPPIDSWVTVTGTWRAPTGKVQPYVDVVELQAESVKRVNRPENPYDPG